MPVAERDTKNSVIHANRCKFRRSSGFSLIELLIAIAIVGILAAVAYPSYQESVLRGNRTAAQSAMMDIATIQQQYLMANRSYATKAQITATGYALPSDVSPNYDWAIALGAGTVPTYTITFTAKGSQASDGNLTLNSQGVKTPADKW